MRETDHSPASRAEVKNEWSFTVTLTEIRTLELSNTKCYPLA